MNDNLWKRLWKGAVERILAKEDEVIRDGLDKPEAELRDTMPSEERWDEPNAHWLGGLPPLTDEDKAECLRVAREQQGR